MSVKINGDVSFWYADIGGVPDYRPALPGNRQADVCIVGAGFTGLWTAYYLKKADPSLNIVILEKEFSGFGASGRNGGNLAGSFGWSRKKYLEGSSRSSVIELERALTGCVDEIISVAELEGIDADIRRTDQLRVACSRSQLERLRKLHAEGVHWELSDGRNEMIGGLEMRRRIEVADAVGALLTRGVARLQPAKLVRGLAEAISRSGVTIYEQTTATAIRKGEVVTPHGVVKAERIVRATEGYTAELPGYERVLIPLNSAMLVTEPLSDDVWKSIGWSQFETLGSESHVYAYLQRTRGNRITIGGRGVPYRYGSKTDDRGATQRETIAQLSDMLVKLLPQTRGIRFDHAWCGVLGVPRDWCAGVGLDKRTGIAWAGGYVGQGVSTANLAGRTLTDLLLDRSTDLTQLPWVDRMPKNWEIEPIRWLGVHAMYKLYQMADLREVKYNLISTSRLARIANRLAGR